MTTEATSTVPVEQICIVGGGNASQVLAALLGNARDNGSGIKVTMLAPFGNEAERLNESVKVNGGISLENPDESITKGAPDVISKDPAECVPGSKIVLLPLPTFAMPDMCKMIAPHLDKGAWVGALPGQGGFQWIAGNVLDMSPEGKAITIFAMDKLPYNCRAIEYAKLVKVYGYKEHLGVATIPSDAATTATVAATLSKSIPKLQMYSIPNFLTITLAPSNQCIHPARMYGLFHEKETLDRIPLFYEEMDDFSANMIQSVSDDIQTLARAIEAGSGDRKFDLSGVLTVKDALVKVYEIDDPSTTRSAFATCHGFFGIGTPMKKISEDGDNATYQVDWGCRYFTEDIPALCVLYALGQIVGAELPTVEKLIRWAQPNMPGAYPFLLEDGSLNGDRTKVMFTPQYWGINAPEDLFEFHTSGKLPAAAE